MIFANRMPGNFADFALARKTGRAMILADILALLWEIIDARAADPLMAGIPGGKTGLLVVKMKCVGGRMIGEPRVDVKLIRELRAVVEQIRKELGQITEKSQADLKQERVRAMSARTSTVKSIPTAPRLGKLLKQMPE
jgi:hypothetical protein